MPAIYATQSRSLVLLSKQLLVVMPTLTLQSIKGSDLINTQSHHSSFSGVYYKLDESRAKTKTSQHLVRPSVVH